MTNIQSIGIDIGGTKIYAGVVENGEIISDVVAHKTPKTCDEIKSIILEIVETFTKQYKISNVGIATAGAVNIDNSGVIGSTGNLPQGYSELKFKPLIEEKYGIFTLIENDANAAAYAEFKFGAAIDAQNTVIITLGTGIGGGIIVDSKILKGKSGAAAEVGHIQLGIEKKRLCTCGTWDCWEAYGSGTGYNITAKEMAALLSKEEQEKYLHGKAPEDVTSYDVLAWKEQGNKFAKDVHQKWENYVLSGLLALANIFDPESIVISGGMAEFLDFDKVEKEINDNIVTTPIKLLHAKMKNHAGFIGAVALALEHNKGN